MTSIKSMLGFLLGCNQRNVQQKIMNKSAFFGLSSVQPPKWSRPRNDPQPWNDPQIDPEMIPISLHVDPEMIPN